MNLKNKSLIFSTFFIITIQIFLYLNNSQKSSFRYFIWNIQEVRIGKLICISFASGLMMSENDFKKTYDGFTKFVLWGTIAVIAVLVILAITLL